MPTMTDGVSSLTPCCSLGCSFSTDPKMDTPQGCGSTGCGGGSAGVYNSNVNRVLGDLCCEGAPVPDAHSLMSGTPLRIIKSRLGDGCYDVTLPDGTSGTFVKVPDLPVAPPVKRPPPPIAPAPVVVSRTEPCETPEKMASKSLLRELSSGAESGEAERNAKANAAKSNAGAMRAGGRHQLIDIHGLAVFLRQSTRCLSCQAACCLYVTGTISAHLAAVTQVKITCQKCHYTASQALARPPSSDDITTPPASRPAPCSPPHLTPLPDPASTLDPHPHPSPFLLQPHLYSSEPLLPAQTNASSLTPGKVKPTLAWTAVTSTISSSSSTCSSSSSSSSSPSSSSSTSSSAFSSSSSSTSSSSSSSSLHSLLTQDNLRPTEEVWVKEEVQPSSKEHNATSNSEAGADTTSAAIIPSLTKDHPLPSVNIEWRSQSHLGTAGATTISAPMRPLPYVRATRDNSGQNSSLSTNGRAPNTNMSPVKKEVRVSESSEGSTKTSDPKSKEASMQRVSTPTSSCSASSASSSSYTSSSSASSPFFPPSSLFPSPASALLRLLSSSMFPPSSVPYHSPIYSPLLPQPTLPDHPHPLGALEFKRKLEADLEESLRLLRKMINKNSPTSCDTMAIPGTEAKGNSQPEAANDVSSSTTKNEDMFDSKSLLSSYGNVFRRFLEDKDYNLGNLSGTSDPQNTLVDSALDLSKGFPRLNESFSDSGFSSKSKKKYSKTHEPQRKRMKTANDGSERKRKNTSKKNEHQSQSTITNTNKCVTPEITRTDEKEQDSSYSSKRDSHHGKHKSKHVSCAKREHKHQSSKQKMVNDGEPFLSKTSEKTSAKKRKCKERWIKSKHFKTTETCSCHGAGGLITTESDASLPSYILEDISLTHDNKGPQITAQRGLSHPKKRPSETFETFSDKTHKRTESQSSKIKAVLVKTKITDVNNTNIRHTQKYERNSTDKSDWKFLSVTKSSVVCKGEEVERDPKYYEGDANRPSWRFHDLLSDCDTDSDSDQLMIDTDN